MRGVEVICDLGGWSLVSSTRDAGPMVVAQRLLGTQNHAALHPQGLGWAVQLPRRGRPGEVHLVLGPCSSR